MASVLNSALSLNLSNFKSKRVRTHSLVSPLSLPLTSEGILLVGHLAKDFKNDHSTSAWPFIFQLIYGVFQGGELR